MGELEALKLTIVFGVRFGVQGLGFWGSGSRFLGLVHGLSEQGLGQ